MINQMLAKQVETLVRIGYPAMFGIPEHEFIASIRTTARSAA